VTGLCKLSAERAPPEEELELLALEVRGTLPRLAVAGAEGLVKGGRGARLSVEPVWIG
jgi:hypothetical protein